jgi:oxygen-independent coproporphyrinogen-3 oxidase
VSLGVQSLDPGVLSWLGRAAGPEQTRQALALACEIFPQVSADWILAPGCESHSLAAEFREAHDLGVGHVSFYILEWHEQTGLAVDRARGLVQPDSESSITTRYLAAREDLIRLDYRPYEVSNYALPGQESRHNAAYWQRRPYLGLGPGAHGQWGCWREANHGSMERWQQEIEQGIIPTASRERLSPEARRLERWVLGLRTVAGVALDDLELDSQALADGSAEGLWNLDHGRLTLTAAGWLRIDDIESWLTGFSG